MVDNNPFSVINHKRRTQLNQIKEFFICIAIIAGIMFLDRMLIDLYFFNLYGTGCMVFDIVTALHTRGFSLLKYAIPLLFVFSVIKERREFQFGMLLPIASIYISYLLTSLFSKNIDYWRFKDFFEMPALFLLFLTLNLQTEKSAKRFFRVAVDLYIVLLTINALFRIFPQLYEVLFPMAWPQECFLGTDNIMGPILITGMLYALLDQHINGGKIRLSIYVILFIINEYLIWVATALVAAIIIGFYFIPFIKRIFEKTDFLFFISLSVLLFVTLVFLFKPISSFPPVKFIIESVLQKKVTLSGRVYLWPAVVELIVRRPILGHGMGDSIQLFYSEYEKRSLHAHNAFLQTWYEGGLVTLFVVSGFLAYFARILRKMEDRELASFFSVVMFAVLVALQADQLAFCSWYQVFIIAQIASLMPARRFSYPSIN